MNPNLLLVLLAAGSLTCGCGSIVVSTKENALPNPSEPITGLRYYLPKGRVQVSAKWDKIKPGWEPTGLVVAEADPEQCYRLDRRVNGFFDDQIRISVNPNTGLLEAAEATSSDQSINAVGSLAAGVAAAFTFGAELGPQPKAAARGAEAEQRQAQLAEFQIIKANAFQSSFQVLVDIDSPTQTVYLVSSEPVLDMKLYARYDIYLERVAMDSAAAANPTNFNPRLDGIAVRLPAPYKLTITGTFYKVHVAISERGDAKSEAKEPQPDPPQIATIDHIFLLPDPDHTYFLPLARIPLVTSSTKVSLKDGMVQSLERSRPSMVAAVAGVPKTILSALVPIPIQIHQSQTVSASSDSARASNAATGALGASSPRK